jgi:hypothetical protein
MRGERLLISDYVNTGNIDEVIHVRTIGTVPVDLRLVVASSTFACVELGYPFSRTVLLCVHPVIVVRIPTNQTSSTL